MGIIDGTGANDVIVGTDGDDVIRARGGNDRVFAGDGDDKIGGGKGDDLLFGGDGDDLIEGKNGNDTLVGGDGDDTLVGGAGNDWLNAGSGNDELYGGSGDDVFYFDIEAIFDSEPDQEWNWIWDFERGSDILLFDIGRSNFGFHDDVHSNGDHGIFDFWDGDLSFDIVINDLGDNSLREGVDYFFV